jgi:hypothetical protein
MSFKHISKTMRTCKAVHRPTKKLTRLSALSSPNTHALGCHAKTTCDEPERPNLSPYQRGGKPAHRSSLASAHAQRALQHALLHADWRA